MLITNPLNSSELVFPTLECFHIVGFALSIGTIAIVDFSLLGIGMRRQSPAQLAKDTWLWTLSGLVLMFFSGLLLFSSDPDMYYLNWPFLIKMVFFVSAVVFHYTVHRKTVASDTPPPTESWWPACRWRCGAASFSAGSSSASFIPGLSLG